jgi:Peptidase family M23
MVLGLGCLVPPQLAFGQVAKKCPEGLTVRVNKGIVAQGGLLTVSVDGVKPLPELKSDWNGKLAPLWAVSTRKNRLQGWLGVDLEMKPGKYEWTISWKGADGNALSCGVPVSVRPGKFATESLKVENQFVQPDPEQQKRAAEDQKKMRAIYDSETPERLWEGRFRVPLDGVTTGGNFGRRRILNGQPRSPHAGVDFPAAAGTPVFAAQSGRVALAEELFYSGNTVVIDHGYGIYTLYAHLSAIEVKPGASVTAATEIGKVGATGRVTGPHLHWGLTVNQARVNALNIVQRAP